MFALGALVTFTLICAALYGVLRREMTRHQDNELATNMQGLRYGMERFGDSERWPRIVAKLDAITPADGSIRFWVLSDDPRFQYGKGVAQMERISQGPDGRGMLVLPPDEKTFRTLSQSIPAFGDRPEVRLIIGLDTAPYERTMRVFLVA